MDKKKYAEHKQKDEANDLRKLEDKRARNKISQRKRRDRMRGEKAELSEEEQGSPVSSLSYTL